MFKVHEVSPFQSVHDWVHESHNVPRQQHFDEVVANIYSRQQNQCIGSHTDQNPLLGAESDILSLSMGAAGVFFWHPHPGSELLRGWNKKQADRHATERDEGKWGVSRCSQEICFWLHAHFSTIFITVACLTVRLQNSRRCSVSTRPAKKPERFSIRQGTCGTLTIECRWRTGQ